MLTMAAQLTVCTKDEQRSVIRFLWSEGVSGDEIHRRLSAQYGNSVLLKRSVYEWIEKLKNVRTSVTHEERAGRPSTDTSDDNTERVRYMVVRQRLTINEVANRLQISHGSAYEIIHNRLGLHKFVQDGSQNTSQCCINKSVGHLPQNLDRYDKEGDAFLDRIITGDETWVHHYEPECKLQSMEWKHPKSPIRKEFKSQPSAGKLMLTVFFGTHKAQYWNIIRKGVQQ